MNFPGSFEQPEFAWDRAQDPSGDGVDRWHQERARFKAALSKLYLLPFDHSVEIWLLGGVKLVGVLKIREEPLVLPEKPDWDMIVEVAGVAFAAREIESCVKRD